MSRTVVLERSYPSPPEQIFNAWIDVEILQTWFGCGPDMLWEIHEWDPRVGGNIRVSLDFDGTPFIMEGEFLVVEGPHHLQYRWGEEERVTVDIAATATGSALTLTHEGLPTDEHQAIVTEGWTTGLGQLTAASAAPRIAEVQR